MTTSKKLVHNQWAQEYFEGLKHIVWCEECGATDGSCGKLTHAHRKKRDFIGYETEKDHEEFTHWVAKLGVKCHQKLDEAWNEEGEEHFDPHQRMFDRITYLVTHRRADADLHIC